MMVNGRVVSVDENYRDTVGYIYLSEEKMRMIICASEEYYLYLSDTCVSP